VSHPLQRALIVEDERSWQQILEEILVDEGLTVDVAENQEMAITYLRAHPHRVAVVDLSLRSQDPHNQDGLKVLDAVRRLDPGCASILLTGFATVELAVSVLTEYNALTCLRKEAFQRSQFRQVIHQALAAAPPEKTASLAAGLPRSGQNGRETPGQANNPEGSVLVVEDDGGWRGILSELLTDSGYRVRLCAGYGEALGYLHREKFSLAVVDLSLSGQYKSEPSEVGLELEGYRLLAGAHAEGIPTIVVSGVANPAEIERAYSEHRIFAFLEKQAFDRRGFLRVVKEARALGRAASELDVLTDREREVLELLARGLTNKEIAEQLVISTNTVKRHIKSIFEKLDIHTRSAAAAKMAGSGEAA